MSTSHEGNLSATPLTLANLRVPDAIDLMAAFSCFLLKVISPLVSEAARDQFVLAVQGITYLLAWDLTHKPSAEGRLFFKLNDSGELELSGGDGLGLYLVMALREFGYDEAPLRLDPALQSLCATEDIAGEARYVLNFSPEGLTFGLHSIWSAKG